MPDTTPAPDLKRGRRKSNKLGSNPAQVDRLPPYSLEVEQAVISCVLQEPEDALNSCEERDVQPDWFYDARHQVVWLHILELHRAGTPLDLITLHERLRGSQELDGIGGLAYLNTLEGAAPSVSMLPTYLDGLEAKHLQRELIYAGNAAVELAYAEQNQPVGELVAEALKRFERLAEQGTPVAEEKIPPILFAAIRDLEDYHRGSVQIQGLTTGLEYFDKLTGGIGGDDNNMIVVSARPGMGKTSFALGVALHVALDFEWFTPVRTEDGEAVIEDDKVKIAAHGRGLPVGIFSLEMTKKALVKRMLFQRAGADMQRFRTGFADASDFPRLTKATEELKKAPVWIDDTGRITMDALKARARRMKRQHDIRLFIVDYIQLLRAGGRRFRDDRVQELADISGELQSLGKELRTPFLILAQMNRDYEKDPNRPPRLSDLKDCGAIEQDADIVAFLYAPKKADEDERYEEAMQKTFGKDWSRYPRRIDALVAKNRNGPSGKCELLFHRASTRFEDFNVWLKANGFKKSAAGERIPDLPTNDEMQL